MIDTPPLTPDHLRAIVVHAYRIAKSHYGYAQWLRDQGYDDHAAQATQQWNSRPLNEQMVAQEGGGFLNQDWTEWLMGAPIEWTACALSETG